MRRLLLPLTLLSCGHNSHDQTPDACTIEVVALAPADGDAEVAVDAPIRATLSRPDSSATFLLEDADGQPVPGHSKAKGDTLRFLPDAPLATDTTYTATLRYCLDTPAPAVAVATFASLSTAGPAEGKSYRIDLTTATWISPVIGSFLSSYISSDLLFQVTRQVADRIEMMGATTISRGGPQDTCYATMPFPEGSMTAGGAFVIGPASVVLPITGANVPVTDMTIEGQLAADLTTVEFTSVTGQISTVDLGATLGPLFGTSDPAELCSLLTMFGDSCVECNDGSGHFCVDAHLSNLRGDELPEETVQCVGLDFCHPDCASSTCTDPNEGVCD